MGEAQREPERTPIQEWLRKFETDYRTLNTRAREAAETTATAAWSANYKTQRLAHDAVEAAAIQELESCLATLKLSGTTESLEKSMKDAIKTLAEERIDYAAWMQRAVENYRRSAESLDDYINGIIHQARKVERENPLIERDFERDVKRELHGWTRAKWDEELGQVVLEFGL
jgi:hypothetical protein